MEWNNAREYAQFKKEQEKLREEYLAAGMKEEQIKAMYKYDLKYLNLRQREARHTQELDISAFDDEGDDEAKNPLYKKFLHCFSKEDKHWEDEHFGWIEEIENENMYRFLQSMSESDKKIMTLLLDGYTQTEIASQIGVTQQAISKRLKKFQKIFQILKDKIKTLLITRVRLIFSKNINSI